RRATTLRFDPAPDRLEASMAQFTLDIAPQQARSLFVEIRCSGDGCEGTEKAPLDSRQARHFFRALREARRALRQSASRAASIVTSNDIFNEAVRRSISDLYMLATDTPEGPVPYAGLPWYSTVFGRDALITAMQMLWADPEFARGVLLHL